MYSKGYVKKYEALVALGWWREGAKSMARRIGLIAAAKARARYIALSSAVGGDDKPRDSGGERRFCEAPPGAGVDIGAYGPTISARRSRNGIKKLFGEAKREICRTSKRRARKLRKRVDHQKEADFDPHQQPVPPRVSRVQRPRLRGVLGADLAGCNASHGQTLEAALFVA